MYHLKLLILALISTLLIPILSWPVSALINLILLYMSINRDRQSIKRAIKDLLPLLSK